MPMHATNCIFHCFIEVKTTKIFSVVVKRCAIRKVKIRPHALGRFKLKQYAVQEGRGLHPRKCYFSDSHTFI